MPVENTKIISDIDLNKILKKSKDVMSIDYIITKFPIDLRNGSTCSRDFFRGLDECI